MMNLEFQRGAINAGEAVSNAWELLKNNYGMYLGIALIAIIMTGCIPCINLFLIGPVMGGVYYVVLRHMRGEPVEFGMMFQGFQKFVPLMVIGLIQSIPGIIAQVFQYAMQFAQGAFDTRRGGGADFFQVDRDLLAGGMLIVFIVGGLVLFVVGILWWACFFFAIPIAMEQEVGPIDAIKLSSRAAMANMGGMMTVLLYTIGISLLGMLMLCLGIFLFSIPLLYVANAFVYRQVFPDLQNRYNMTPPPPTAYGGGYGQQNFGQV